MRRVMSAAVGIAIVAISFRTAGAATIKVGVIASFTGSFASWGRQFQDAIEAYQAVYGKSVKGPDGKTYDIEFVYRDTTSGGPDKAKQLAGELVLGDRVKFLAGFDLSPYAMAMAEVSTQAKVPVIIMNAATASITRGSPYYVRVSFTIPQLIQPAAQWSLKNGVKTAYTLVSDYAPGYDAEGYFVKTFKAGGGEILGSARTPLNETNFAAYQEKVLQAKPDMLFMFQPAGAPSIAFMKTFVERGLKAANIKLMGGGEVQEALLPSLPDDVTGTLSAAAYTPTNNYPENTKLKMQLEKLSNGKSIADPASAAAWDGVNVIYKAVSALGDQADGIKYVDFLKGKTFDSPRGKITIDPVERDVIQDVEIRRVDKIGGKLVNVVIDRIADVKDPWKLDNPARAN